MLLGSVLARQRSHRRAGMLLCTRLVPLSRVIETTEIEVLEGDVAAHEVQIRARHARELVEGLERRLVVAELVVDDAERVARAGVRGRVQQRADDWRCRWVACDRRDLSPGATAGLSSCG